MFASSAECSSLAHLVVALEGYDEDRSAVLYALYVLHRMPLAMKASELPPLRAHNLPRSLEWVINQREVA
jgi:hypothetical protein